TLQSSEHKNSNFTRLQHYTTVDNIDNVDDRFNYINSYTSIFFFSHFDSKQDIKSNLIGCKKKKKKNEGLISTDTVVFGIVGDKSIKPYSILILFMSLSYIGIALDQSGVLAFVSYHIVNRSNNNINRLFLFIATLSAVMTVLASNDIVILTITQIVYYYTLKMQIPPMPFLMVEFFSANIWSSVLYIGNPTNIIVAQAFNVAFLDFTKWTLLPTIACGVVAMTVAFFLYKEEFSLMVMRPQGVIVPRDALHSVPNAIIGTYKYLLYTNVETYVYFYFFFFLMFCLYIY
ncbi:hypothetical protein RFI_36575, partial [Reticulomyxa filosa]